MSSSASDDVNARLQEIATRTRPPAKAVDVLGGVTVQFLSEVFRMDRRDINWKLRECPVMGGVRHRDSQTNLYDLATAAQYLVKPKFDPAEYLKTMRASELPTHLQDQFWSAMNKRQKWEENAEQLWRTERVMEVFGVVFQLIKSTMQLWAENMQRAEGLRPEQKRFLQAQVDGLQQAIHEKLVALPLRTAPQKSEIAHLVAPAIDEAASDHDDLI